MQYKKEREREIYFSIKIITIESDINHFSYALIDSYVIFNNFENIESKILFYNSSKM